MKTLTKRLISPPQPPLFKELVRPDIARLLTCFLLLLVTCSACTKKKVYYQPPAQQETTTRQNFVSTELIRFYEHWQGTPYRLGGMSLSGIDCSAFTQIAYRDLFDMQIPRTVAEQVRYGKKISARQLQPGDLVFFKTGFFQRHVGIYVSDSRFAHASTSSGVMLSSLDNSYWRDAYWKSTRLLDN